MTEAEGSSRLVGAISSVFKRKGAKERKGAKRQIVRLPFFQGRGEGICSRGEEGELIADSMLTIWPSRADLAGGYIGEMPNPPRKKPGWLFWLIALPLALAVASPAVLIYLIYAGKRL